MKMNFGCSGWYYKHWKGKFYPDKLPQKEWFNYYSSKFDTVELNAPFYRFPTDDVVKLWYNKAPKNFIYTMKASRIITHIKRFNHTQEWIDRYYKVCSNLKEKLGCILFQLPPSTKFSIETLEKIASQLNYDFTNVIEFRHKSWFNEETYKFLAKNGIVFCILSSPRMPSDFVKTSKDIYVRFHGSFLMYAHNYSKKELTQWAEKIKKSKARNAYGYFNNDFNGFAPKNCLELVEILKVNKGRTK